MQSPTDHNESTQEAQDEVSELNAVQSDALDASEEQDDSESTIVEELAENSSSEVVEAPKVSFDTFDLQKPLREAIDTLGFEFCTPIQAQSLVHTLQGHDVTGKAQTGTGKTAAFLITIINDLLSNPIQEKRYLAEPRALIVAPTRELAIQIASDLSLIHI